MKYRRLTKEQIEGLSEEFAKFLASQQIDKKEWDSIKKNKPLIVEEELDIFSDLVWEDILDKVEYLEHFSKKQLNLFHCKKHKIIRILVTVDKQEFNFLNKDDYKWALNNIKEKCISFYNASKDYKEPRNIEVFKLIEKGAIITKGDLFKNIKILVKKMD